jgi:hypothetical protein
MESVEVRFWAKVDIRCYNECWNWIAGKTEDGMESFAIQIDTLLQKPIEYLG